MTTDDLYPNTTRYIKNALEYMKQLDGAPTKQGDIYVRAAAVWADLADVAQRIEQSVAKGDQ